ncbi:hypothetical protein [Methylobacterium longum]|uniref:Secreted protein n=1 Tax=Methylobacterium longum TaxID=767694 RepID=A0ABT8AVF1_9HYPH|nr:hypothetical protein [Methylobacterium longum]MDN3573923.1 hypothetical protein [Methylobacterium longum]GJE13593.1 hypothetical protein FOHLNKBM_4657 [Methylobacterium longum]
MTRLQISTVTLMLAFVAGLAAGSIRPEARDRPAQGTVTIPSDAELNRLEREAITTPPLDVSGTPPRGGGGARDRRERRIERRPPERGGACDDC